jgi:hypothetical protein
MKKTLQDQYLLIKEGKGHKGVFLTEAKRQFPSIVRNAATFDEALASLKTKNIISENIISVMPAILDRPKKEAYELAFESFLAEAKKKKEEDEKAELKKPSKQVEEDLDKIYNNTDEKNPDNMIFDQIMTGYYAEMKDPKNVDKTMQELKDMVFKNLSKDPIFYTKDGQFGTKGLGYTTEAPGLGTPKEAKGKYKASGYGDLNEGMFSSKPLGDVEGAKEDTKKAIKAFLTNNTQLKSVDDFTDKELLKALEGFARAGENELSPQANKTALMIYKIAKPLFEEESLEESKLRTVIRELISEELDEMIKINPTKGGGGRRFIPTDLNLSNDIIKKFDLANPGPNAPAYDESIKIPHIIVGSPKEGGTPVLFISDFLDIALRGITRGRTTRETEVAKNTLQKMQGDITDKDWSMVRALIKKYSQDKSLDYPIKGKLVKYHEIKFPSDPKMLGNEFETGYLLDKTDNGLKITLPKKLDKSKEDFMESLRESVEKDLIDINKEAEHEILQFKLDKIDALTDKRKMQLGKLDEDEDMKALTDKNKVKELEKDVKKLEAARKKVEKMMLRFKGKKKEVIDEVEDDIDVDPEYLDQSVEDLDLGKTVDSIDTDNSNLALSQQQDIKDYLNSIAPSDQKSRRTYG